MSIKLYDHQQEVLDKLETGAILCGGVGSGKSIASLAYYLQECGGTIKPNGAVTKMSIKKDLYIITTAKKRDSLEWEKDCSHFLFKPVVDSWNNIKNYSSVANAFFIFDEQRVVGYGAWSKTFIAIAKKNDWILLSATPGDTWMDYLPVFIANGFYKNKRDFVDSHVVYSQYSKFPKIERYVYTGKLIKLRSKILVPMPTEKKTTRVKHTVKVGYDKERYRRILKDRWSFTKEAPITNASELRFELLRLVNSDPSRIEAVRELILSNKRCIIFYNYTYELDILRELTKELLCEVAEWNGQKHELVPTGKEWVYLVQYTAGSEGWNCVETDTMIFYSLNYSFRQMEQACGRIDRINTPYKDLYYYYVRSDSSIDLAIAKAIGNKKNFNMHNFDKLHSREKLVV